MNLQPRLAVGFLLAFSALTASSRTSWRDAWSIALSISPRPCTLLIKFSNRSESDLLGLNNIFTISRNGSFYGYAFDSTLRPRPVSLPSGTSLQRRSDIRKLVFADGGGKPLSTETFIQDLQVGAWTISSSVTDKNIKKPSTESSYLVFSNSVELDQSNVSKCLSPNNSFKPRPLRGSAAW